MHSDACQPALHTSCLAEETSSSHETFSSKLQRAGPPSPLLLHPPAARPPTRARGKQGRGFGAASGSLQLFTPAGRTKFCTVRAQGEAYCGKGLHTQSRLASKSPHNQVEQELCSRALMGTMRSIQTSLPHGHPCHSCPNPEQPSHRGTGGCPSSSALHQLPPELLAFGCLWE